MRMTFKYHIKHSLLDYVFSQEVDRLKETLAAISTKNACLFNIPTTSFRYKGEIFSYYTRATETVDFFRLHASLIPEMDNYLRDRNLMQKDFNTVDTALSTILNKSGSLVDLILIFPKCLHSKLRELVSQELPEPRSLTDIQCNQIKEECSKAFELIELRMAMNLLS